MLKIGNKVVSQLGLDHDVVNVGLNGPPDEVPKTLEHTTLVCSLAFFRSNSIET